MRLGHAAIIATLAASLPACGKYLEKFSRLSNPNSSTVKFSQGQPSLLAPTMVGGVMVYALRADGYREGILLQNEEDATEFQLPNGAYRFLAVGWDTVNLEGTAKCGIGNLSGTEVFNLDGSAGAKLIPITLAAATCATDTFSTANFRVGANFTNPDVVFCGPNTNFAAITSITDSCNNGLESQRFFAGLANGGAGVGRAGPDALGSRFVYTADQHAAGRVELFSVGFSGTGTLKLNPPLTAGGTILDMDRIANTNKIVYLAKQDSTVVSELYIASSDSPGSGTKISGAIDTIASGWGVKNYRISNDGRWVIFAGKMRNSPGVVELFSVDLQTSGYPRTVLNADATGAYGIQDGPIGGGSWYLFEVGKQSPYRVAYAGNLNGDTANKFHVYAVNPDGSNHLKISNASCTNAATQEVRDLNINFDGTKAGWIQDCATDNQMEGMVTPLSGGSIYTLHGTPINQGVSRLYLSPTADKAVFDADDATAGYYDLYSVDFSSMNQATINSSRVKLFDQTVSAGLALDNVRFSGNGANVYYLRDTDPSGAYNLKLYAGPVASATSHELISPAGTSTNNFYPNQGGGPDGPVFFSGNNDIYFLSDAGSHVTRKALYKYTINTTGPGTFAGYDPSTVPNAGNSDVKSARPGPGGKIYHTMDKYTDGTYMGLVHDPAGPSNTSLDLSATMLSTQGFHFPQPGEPTFGSYSNGAMVAGLQASPTSHEDIWFMPDVTAGATGLVKLSRMYAGSGVKLGRYRYALLKYKGDMGSATPAITSACHTGPATDGVSITFGSYRIPAGDGNSPFALAMDVFPDATSCSGPFDRYIFPNGLAGGASRVKVIGAGSSVRIFFKD